MLDAEISLLFCVCVCFMFDRGLSAIIASTILVVFVLDKKTDGKHLLATFRWRHANANNGIFLDFWMKYEWFIDGWMDGWMYFSTNATIFKPTWLFDIRIWIQIRIQVRKASPGVCRSMTYHNRTSHNKIDHPISMNQSKWVWFLVFLFLVLCLSLNLCFYFSHSSKKIYNIFFLFSSFSGPCN